MFNNIILHPCEAARMPTNELSYLCPREEPQVVRLAGARHVLHAVGQLELHRARLQPHRAVAGRRRRQLDALHIYRLVLH